VIEKAVSEGAKVLMPAADQFWGDRVGRIVDPAGHVWNIASRIGAPLGVNEQPNHSTEPTPPSGTSAAGHPPRQP
jgi:hypothetical protein